MFSLTLALLLVLVTIANALPVKVTRPGAEIYNNYPMINLNARRPDAALVMPLSVNLPLPTGAPSSALPSTSSTSTSPSSATSSPSSTPSSSSSAASSSAASASSPSQPSSATTSTSTPSATPSPPPSSGSPKYVVAHHMVGNTFPYTLSNWAADIALAHSSGIDGFALNVGSDSWQPARVADAYQAALQSGLDFKLFLSFDMSSLPCASPNDAQTLRTYITTYSSHPNQLKMSSRTFASTFAGESCAFGQGSVPTGWSSQFTQHPELTGANAVYFAPSFFVDPGTFGTFADVMDGDFNFNSGWPIDLTASSAQSLIANLSANLNDLDQAATQVIGKVIGTTDTDTQHLNALAAMPSTSDGEKRAYVAAVSPWFFTHYSPQTFHKNFIYMADSHLYPTRWESLVNIRDQVDIVEIVTWNDYGESHYIGPIEGAQPNSQAWVDGLNHTGWLDMTNYYATAFKTGSFPTITEDKIYLWARTHPKDANVADPVGKPTNFELTQDTLWAVVQTTAPSTVTLSTSPTTSQTFSVPSGVSKLSMPLTPGGNMKGVITRNGADVVDLEPEGYVFDANPTSYNFNAFVAYSG
ncbi:glycoside hydrolase family 71 protein [Jaapia argillacea MUCL 33604]|uniref:Glycoside hydrolase family 71 protein n=1 Tax=Jaapia argillacea MUCL 33604 TaxID=933084 RepID=A0A067Q5T4_9AGAM|nr:glycoside hydrolase family 71 protein [Jaapia argillacea MUCL 33604]